MKKIICMLLLLYIWQPVAATSPPATDPEQVINEMMAECKHITEMYNQRKAVYQDSITVIEQRLLAETSTSIKIDLLITKDVYENRLRKLEFGLESDITKLRYIKGMEIIKILYDKVLGLDHHFASVRTFSENVES
jgi:hypothetical protein